MKTDIFNTCHNSAGKVSRIVTFLESTDNFFIAIGQPTEWTADEWGLGISDENPPVPDEKALNIPNPIIYKRIERVQPAIRNTACADLVLDTKENLAPTSITERTFSLINTEDIYEADDSLRIVPSLLYISTTVESTDYSTDGYRAIGFFTKLRFKTGVTPHKLVYTPEEIEGGYLHWSAYHSPIDRAQNKYHHIEFLMHL